MASAATSVPPGSGAPGGGTVASTGPHPPPASSAPPPQTSVVPLPSQHHGSGPPPPSHNVQPPTGLSGGPTSSQHYSLRWNNHQSHVLNAFDALLQNESLVDCTLVCEDTSIRAHKVVLSACSPYFQKIFMDNPHKNPIIILKDVRGWEVQCIVDFMYKGETSVPEAQLTGLIKAAEGLKVRGLTSSDQVPRNANLHVDTSSPRSRHSSPMNVQVNGYHHGAPPPSHHPPSHRGYSSSPARSYPSHHDSHHHDSHHGSHHAKIPHLTGPHSNQSSPMSLTNHQDDRDRAAHMQHNGDRLSPPNSGINGSGPRRKQARPRRRSGDSVGNSSLDLSKSDSPINAGTPYNAHHVSGLGRKDPGSSPTSSAGSSQHNPSHLHDDATPENLSMKRPSSSPAINLVKTETLLEQQDRARATSASSSELSQRAEREALRRERDRTHSRERTPISDGHGSKPVTPSSPFLPAAAAAAALHGMHHFQEHPARQELEALQALDYMRAGGGLPPHFPPPPGHPLNGHSTQLTNGPGGPINASSLAGLAAVSAAAAAQAASAGRPTSTPTTPSNNAFGGHPPPPENGKNNFEFQRIAFDRSKMSEEEAFEHAIEMIQTRQMGFRKAADFFSVSKWKLYKTARKRGIYAEIKKQNAAQALTKVPTNVQHFADMGVYKQLKKKTHLTKEVLFPHLPGVANGGTNGHADVRDEARKVFKSANAHNNNNLQHIRDHRDHLNNHSSFVTMAEHLQKKMGYPPVNGRPHNGSPGPSTGVDLHRSLSMPAQTTTNGPQMLPPQRSSGSGGDDEPISDIDEDEMDENIDVDDVGDDITPNGGLTPQPTILTNGSRHIGSVVDDADDDEDDDSEPRRLVISTRDDVRITTTNGDRHGDSNGSACNSNENSSNGVMDTTSPDEEDSSREDSA